MKLVTIEKDSPIDLLAEPINDITDSGDLPDKCIIICGGLRYQVGFSTDDEIAGALAKESLAIMLSDMFEEE